jgi:hypothetical protein
LTSTSKKNSPRALVLNKKEVFVKLDENIIIGNKAMNGEKMLVNMWNVKDII